jgi:hypothetical protein
VGLPVRVTVTDGDMDYTRDVPDTITATVWAGSDTAPSGIFDQRVITLTETAASTGIFTGQIGTTMGSPQCDVNELGVFSQQGQVIKAWYNELAPIGTISATPFLTLTWPATLEILENNTWIGSSITVRMVDRDRINGASPPSISFTASVSTKTSIPTINLAATASGSDTFTGTLQITSVSKNSTRNDCMSLAVDRVRKSMIRFASGRQVECRNSCASRRMSTSLHLRALSVKEH